MPRNWPIQAGATSLGNGCSRLLNSTRLGPGAEHEKRAADYPESREGYRESAHPRMRSARIIQLRLRLCPLIEVNRPLLLQCGNFRDVPSKSQLADLRARLERYAGPVTNIGGVR